MKTFTNIFKLIISIIVISLVVLGIITIVKNISSLGDVSNNSNQIVVGRNAGIKNVNQVIVYVESIVF